MNLDASTPLVSDAVDPWIGLVLIGGLFFAYSIQRRNRRLARAVESRPAVASPPTDAPTAAYAANPPEFTGPAPSFGISIIYTFLLIAAGTHLDSWWGYLWQAILGVMIMLALVSTVSRRAYESERAQAPTLTRGQHLFMNGVPYVLFPFVGWVLVVPFGWVWGAVVPGVIWLVPFVASLAIDLWETIRGPVR